GDAPAGGLKAEAAKPANPANPAQAINAVPMPKTQAAAVPQAEPQNIPTQAVTANLMAPPSRKVVELEIRSHNSSHFEPLIGRWQVEYGTSVFPILVQIAEDIKMPERSRYIALMGATKLGGTGAKPVLIKLLKDPSPIVRNASLVGLRALGDPSVGPKIFP